jgi:hypothetical protein
MSVKEKPLTARQRSGSKISETMATIVPTGRLVGVAALARYVQTSGFVFAAMQVGA